MSASKKSPDQIGLLAVGMVAEERLRQANKGYSRAHDDDHANEELAAAAAFYLLPSWMNQDVCTAKVYQNLILPALQLLEDFHGR